MSTTSRPSPNTPARSLATKAAAPGRAIHITSPQQLINLVPYLLGFHPGQDMVVIGTAQPRHVVRVTLRYSLDPAAVTDQVRHALALLNGQHYDTAVAVGYGPDELVTPFMEWLRPEADEQGITFTELLRVDTGQQRYWSYLRENPDCCPPEGASFELTTKPGAAELSTDYVSGVPASREVLAASIGPCTGDEAASMERATRKAERRLARLLSQTPRPGKPSGRHAVAPAGIKAVKGAIQAYRQGDTLTHDEAAWLTVALRNQWVRDDAVSRMETAHRDAHLRLWTDVTRLALPEYVTTPATLLAFVAWQSGNGALANIALDRALAADPDYSLARIFRCLVDSSRLPDDLNPPLTPEEVAAAYVEHYRSDG